MERLETFCLVVQSGSISAAAVRDSVRQSQFSRQIKDLEEAFGFKLVKRVGKVLKPTVKGLELAALTGAFFSGLSNIDSSNQDESFTLASGDSIIRWFLIPRLSRRPNQGKWPWNLHCMRTLSALEALSTGELDLAIVREDAVQSGYTARPIFELEYTWVFHRDLLPSRTAAGIYNAKSLSIGTLTGDGMLARKINELAEKNNLPFDVQIELENFSLLLEAVKTGKIGALLPKIATADLPSDQFAIINDENLRLPPRGMAVVALTKSFEIRPRLRQAFEKLEFLFTQSST